MNCVKPNSQPDSNSNYSNYETTTYTIVNKLDLRARSETSTTMLPLRLLGRGDRLGRSSRGDIAGQEKFGGLRDGYYLLYLSRFMTDASLFVTGLIVTVQNRDNPSQCDITFGSVGNRDN
ncbi:hypothetical protein LguiB_032222 [Lonicera macranthoides]